MAAGILAAAIVAVSGACTSSSKVNTVSAQEFEQGIEQTGVQVLDVRSGAEYSEGHIKDAENINVDSPEFMNVARLKLSKDKPVYVYCRGGRRSLEAADILVNNGFKVVNLDGGLNNWKSEGLPVVTDSVPK